MLIPILFAVLMVAGVGFLWSAACIPVEPLCSEMTERAFVFRMRIGLLLLICSIALGVWIVVFGHERGVL